MALPVEVSHREIQRIPTFGRAIAYTYEAAGLEPKQVLAKLHSDKAQLSRWESGLEGIVWTKLLGLMDTCGNATPVLWMAHAAGFDITSMRRIETELERQNRKLREENYALRRALQGALNDL